jgi:hypothetical protein
MSDDDILWIWDVWGSKEELYDEFLKGPDKWSDTFRYWVLRHVADGLLDNWLETHDDTDLIREAAEFMECEAMNEVGDPDVDQMVELCQRTQHDQKN